MPAVLSDPVSPSDPSTGSTAGPFAGSISGSIAATAPPADARNATIVGRVGAAALVPMIAAHVVGAGVVDPVVDPISWYAFVPWGGELILVGGLLLAFLGLVLTVRMYRCGLASGPVPAAAMVVYAVAMVLVGVFPTDPPEMGATLSATIHRVSAATAFVVLPLVGLSLARTIVRPLTPFPRLLRSSAYVLGALVGAFLAIHLPLAMVGSGIVAFGLLERIGFIIMIGFLFLIGATIDGEAPGVGAGGPLAAGTLAAEIGVSPARRA
ncbi:DUF998 domain-containing protein [Antribacter gilvus]|uniref:DUF998 domain-containing protein n=1 Tax=Antribacter gilvus TaxID=2304675 RepID=UPI0013DF773C|nr:DUF998 domain-containing protein [Antribacter gilvus]